MVPMEELEVQHLLDLEFHHNQSMDQQHKIKQEPHLVSMAPKGELVVVQLLDSLTFHIPTQQWLITVLKLTLGSMFPTEELEEQPLLDLEFHHIHSMSLTLMIIDWKACTIIELKINFFFSCHL